MSEAIPTAAASAPIRYHLRFRFSTYEYTGLEIPVVTGSLIPAATQRAAVLELARYYWSEADWSGGQMGAPTEIVVTETSQGGEEIWTTEPRPEQPGPL